MGTLLKGLAALSLIGAAGCDVVFGLEREPPPELVNYDRCGAFLYDEPLRYATVSAPSAVDGDGNPLPPTPWSWDDARAACQLRGMDLAVFNDMHELGRGPTEAVWPYWIGQRTVGASEQTVDGCPVNAPTSLRLVAADATACGLVAGPVEIDGASCDGKLPASMEPSIVSTALCETPRPDGIDCLGRDPLASLYILSDAPMPHDKAAEFCRSRDAHLVVFERFDEWTYISKMTKDSWEKPFWVGAQLNNATWETANGCYGTYSWTNGTPGKPESGSCLAAKTRLVADEGEPDLAGTVLDGVEATACDDDQSYALCEVD